MSTPSSRPGSPAAGSSGSTAATRSGRGSTTWLRTSTPATACWRCSWSALLTGPAKRAGLIAGGSFNLGAAGDFRVPDLGYDPTGTGISLYVPTAAVVIEVLSPGDESEAKKPFYAERGVDEVWLVDPIARTVAIGVLDGDGYAPAARSRLLGLAASDLERDLDWP